LKYLPEIQELRALFFQFRKLSGAQLITRVPDIKQSIETVLEVIESHEREMHHMITMIEKIDEDIKAIQGGLCSE
jgi:pimeloyl-CoA synthetase